MAAPTLKSTTLSTGAVLLLLLGTSAWLAVSPTAAQPNCGAAKTCQECLNNPYCNFCTAYLDITLPAPLPPLKTPGGFSVCSQNACDTLTFGTLPKLFDNVEPKSDELKDFKIKMVVEDGTAAICTAYDAINASKLAPSSAFEKTDCKTCVEAISSGDAKGWCQYGIQLDNDQAKVDGSGGICAPCKGDIPALKQHDEDAHVAQIFIDKAADVGKCGDVAEKAKKQASAAGSVLPASTTMIGLAAVATTAAMLAGAF